MLAVGNIINRDQGYRRSLIEERCLTAQGEPIPWYTYPAIEYLSSLDLSESDIFEYGAGASTLWWAKRARSVTSVEALADWYERIAKEMPDNCRLIHEPDLERFPDAIEQCDQTFDVIAVDGPGHAMIRLLCVYFAIKNWAKAHDSAR